MNKPAVINASPLIFFSRAQQMGLLHHFASRILVPEPVADEILMKGAADITAKALDSASWLQIVPVKPIPGKILEWGLGPGESAVLAYADEHPPMEAIIDDLAGRKCADYLNIPVRGTLGIVLVSKKRGFIPRARPVMESLIRSAPCLRGQIACQGTETTEMVLVRSGHCKDHEAGDRDIGTRRERRLVRRNGGSAVTRI